MNYHIIDVEQVEMLQSTSSTSMCYIYAFFLSALLARFSGNLGSLTNFVIFILVCCSQRRENI